MSVRIATAVFVAGASLLLWAQQPSKEAPSWAPKYEPAKYPPGHKPHTKLKDLLAKHKGKTEWREVIVDDAHLKGEYIMSPPGSKVGRRFHPDTREWWVVMDGQIRFDIEGQDSVTATKGSMVQVPMQTIYSMETVGDKPALRFEVNIAKAKTMYPEDVKPPQTPGVEWIPVVLGRKPGPYDLGNKPHINLFELQKDPAFRKGTTRFVHDDRAVSNIIYGYAKDLPPINPNDRGHYHPECAEFWLVMQGQIRYPIEKVGLIIADEGDVVYVPPFTFHAPRWYGDGPSTRLAFNGYPNIAHLREVVKPH
jgi:mannose-6-phosphate isomerase-like protein (cupin superfamily)